MLCLQRGSDELLSQAAVMAPAADNNNQDLATKKAKLDSNSVIGGVGECKYPKLLLFLFLSTFNCLYYFIHYIKFTFALILLQHGTHGKWIIMTDIWYDIIVVAVVNFQKLSHFINKKCSENKQRT